MKKFLFPSLLLSCVCWFSGCDQGGDFDDNGGSDSGYVAEVVLPKGWYALNDVYINLRNVKSITLMQSPDGITFTPVTEKYIREEQQKISNNKASDLFAPGKSYYVFFDEVKIALPMPADPAGREDKLRSVSSWLKLMKDIRNSLP